MNQIGEWYARKRNIERGEGVEMTSVTEGDWRLGQTKQREHTPSENGGRINRSIKKKKMTRLREKKKKEEEKVKEKKKQNESVQTKNTSQSHKRKKKNKKKAVPEYK